MQLWYSDKELGFWYYRDEVSAIANDSGIAETEVSVVPETSAGTIEDLGCFAGGPRLSHVDLSHTGVSHRRGHHSNEEIAAVIQGDFLPAVRENGGVGYFALESDGVFWCFDEARLGEV